MQPDRSLFLPRVRQLGAWITLGLVAVSLACGAALVPHQVEPPDPVACAEAAAAASSRCPLDVPPSAACMLATARAVDTCRPR